MYISDADAVLPVAGGPPPAAPRRISLYNNYVTFFGLFLTAVGLLLLLTFGLFSLISPTANPYVDIIGYLILPGILVTGLLIVPLGIAWKWWRLRRAGLARAGSLALPRIDLNDRRTRAGVLAFLGVTFFAVLPVLGVAGYHGYHLTESTGFCGQTCHTVMEPQATAHAYSPHARVACAECHIGSGASWFVKSKLSGTRQVLAVWQNSFPRPIPPAITELRPARETCEECHWPAQFFGSQYKEFVHFSPDEQNTRRVVKALLKTGGADESIGRVEGIHMHMVLAGQIEYVATDEGLQDVPWVRFVKGSGEELIYRADGKASTDPRPEGLVRRIDCMDCHNRGAHHFRSPQKAVDLYLNVGRIEASLPFIKREAVAILTRPYPDVSTAERAIRRALTDFYRESYPDVWTTRLASVRQAVDMVVDIYRRNVFPEMRVDWRTYPENIGHLSSPGCFRCHDGRHIDQHGRPISSDCNVCHTFLNPADDRSGAWVEGEFRHSMQLVMHGSLRCSQCHTGGPLPLCKECHGSGTWLEVWGRGRFRPEGP